MKGLSMNRTYTLAILGFVLAYGALNSSARAQVAGTVKLGVDSVEYRAVAVGWSARKQIIGHDVYNENGEKVGRVDDLIVTPESAVSFAIVGVGGFVGVHRHHVAIPVNALAPRNEDFELPGATRALIKSPPAFDYLE
jgi:hypothetical protein